MSVYYFIVEMNVLEAHHHIGWRRLQRLMSRAQNKPSGSESRGFGFRTEGLGLWVDGFSVVWFRIGVITKEGAFNPGVSGLRDTWRRRNSSGWWKFQKQRGQSSRIEGDRTGCLPVRTVRA